MILAVDPGPTESAWVLLNGEMVIMHKKSANDEVLLGIAAYSKKPYVAECFIEKIASYGMSVGAEVFETCYWTGRFAQAFGADRVRRVERLKIKLHLCHDSKAKDSNIRQAIIDRFGGKDKAIGTKKHPGPLYGISGDVWAALAVALYAHDMSDTPARREAVGL